ncbi:hypothetical protein AMS68_007381 [Peltaster fructicola]|uniref:SWIRM domain-containing protein n=1 Tax=Peltaster fructicola TaxID=286661 RepID=A0A6H0Y4C5_9PEZI|nr:hypothetical protein AMS68_007381 [Peltaster fructicola]
MANFTQSQPDHRKQAFSQVDNYSSWPTPPTDVEHDFSHNMVTEKVKSMQLKEQVTGIPALHSPPASPVQGWSDSDKLPPLHSPDDAVAHTPLPPITDRQLFSDPHAESQTPLFPTSQSPVEDRTDSLSPAGRQDSPVLSKPILAKPTLSKPSFVSIYNIFPQFQSADREFFRRYRLNRLKELQQIPGWRPAAERTTPVTHPNKHANAAQRPFKVTKPREQTKTKSVPAKPKVPRVSTVASPVAKTIKTPKRERQTASAEPQARKRAPPSKLVVVDNWLEIADYSPPTQTLDSMSNRLRVHWKGVPNDLRTDPEIRHLHPQEVEIAQELKLPANQYLANKRRIFEARLKSIRERKNFTKTAAQQACNIDVNKTSQLYEAYEKVGWFDESNFKQWLK